MPALNTNDYAYIIPPSAQFNDLDGEPYSAGFVEFYKHGTSEKYITYADWAGSFNPFRIPLNSQARAVAIAEIDAVLDMYVYNFLGNLAYSRLNVRTTDVGGAPLRFTSSDGSVVITRENNVVDLTVYHDEKVYGSAEADSTSSDGVIEFDIVNSGDITVVSAGTLRIGSGKLYHVTVSLEFSTSTISSSYWDCQLTDSENTVHKFSLDGSRSKQILELSWDAVSTSDTFQIRIQAPSNFEVTSAELYIHSVNSVVTSVVPQVQSDWNVSDSESPAYIKNKPDLSVYARSADLAEVATTGSYNDLNNIPANLVQDADYVHTDNNFTDSDKEKIESLGDFVHKTLVCPEWTSREALAAYSYRWYGDKIYYNNKPLRSDENFSIPTLLPSVWKETTVAKFRNTVFINISSSNVDESVSISDLKFWQLQNYINEGMTVFLVKKNSSNNAVDYEIFSLLDYRSQRYTFVRINTDGSGATRYFLTAGSNSSVTLGSSLIVLGKIYQPGTGISITGANQDTINCTLDPFPAHTASDANKVITVNSQNQLYWKQLSYNDLANVPTQVQSDWDEANTTLPSYIRNKPNFIPIVGGMDITVSEVDDQLVISYTGGGAGGSSVNDVTVNGSSVVNSSHVAVIDLTPYVLASSLAAVATSGDYSDLSNKPDLSLYALVSSLAAVATSGDYSDLINKPDLSVYALVSSLAAVATSGDYSDLSNKPDLSVYALISSLAAVATSGSYNDLSNKPDLSVYALASSLAAVATSGSYNDLTDKPSIPTITYTTSKEVTDILADIV